MKKRLYFAIALMLVWSSLCAQTYHYTFSHDTLGNRVSRVYQGMVPAKGVAFGNTAGLTTAPQDTSGGDGLWRGIETDALSGSDVGRVTSDGKDTTRRNPWVKTPAEKEAYLDGMMEEASRMGPLPDGQRSLPQGPVGEIPLSLGVSGSGARTYSIPILTAPDIGYAPSLALVYNSQGGYGRGGYGWDLAGVSSITLTGKSRYWDGEVAPASSAAQDGVFCLDGVRLVTNGDTATSAAYPLVTATGHILVAPHRNLSGYINTFTALYPDGSTAVYGMPTSQSYTRPVYPVTGTTSINGEKIEYTYAFHSNSDDERLALTRVSYGFDASGNATATINLGEPSFYDLLYGYCAGKKMSRPPLISTITSTSGGVTLYRYNLSTTLHLDVNIDLLTSISLTNSAGETLPPLTFTYGYDTNPPTGSESLHVEDSIQLPSGITTNPVYRRGKFVAGRHDDGLAGYPGIATYTKSGSDYVCSYPADSSVTFIPTLSATDTVYSFTVGSGFLTAEAADVDGDGMDELVRVQCISTDAGGSVYKITVNKFVTLPTPHINVSVSTVTLKGAIERQGLFGKHYSPYLRAFRWGDFKGDGTTQMLVVSYSDNGYGKYQTSWAHLVDPRSGAIISETGAPQIASSQDRRIFCIDIDGDGRTEMCAAITNGVRIFRCNSQNILTEDYLPMQSVNASVIDTDHTYFADVNADGYIDIIKAPANGRQWEFYLNTGVQFVEKDMDVCTIQSGGQYLFMDIDRDGYPDLVETTGTTTGYYRNKDFVSFNGQRCADTPVPADAAVLPPNTVEYSAMSSFVTVDGHYVRVYGYPAYIEPMRHLVQSHDSYGKTVRNTYGYLPEAGSYFTDNPTGISAADGYQLRCLPVYVLRNSKGWLAPNDTTKVFLQDTYAWYDGVVHARGLGFCGFSKARRAWSLDGVNRAEVTRYDPQRRGVPVAASIHPLSDSYPAFSETMFTYDSNYTQYGKLQPRLIRSDITKSIDGVLSTTIYTYGDFDFPVGTSTRSYATGMTTAIDSTVTVYQHLNSPSRYILGGVTSQTTIHERDGDGVFRAGEKSVFTLDTLLRPLVCQSYRLHGDGRPLPMLQSHASTDRWQYDSHGNVIREESAPSGSAVFIGTSYTYDSSGRHLVSSTDALGHTTTYSSFDIYGNPAVVTNHKGQQTQSYRDSWGRTTRTVHPDGTVDSVSRYWGVVGVYAETRLSSGSPAVSVDYDALGREVYRSTRRFDGQLQKTRTIYDNRGNRIMTSLPYRGTSPSHWNQYQYDSYGRPTRIIEASGKQTKWTYSGTDVTERRDGVRTVRRTGPSGALVSVSDSLSTVTYHYRDDGQPTYTSVTGGATTYFSYDSLGRRTSITDPSAGTRTTAYATNANGYTVVSETNAIGSVVTTSDSLGRVVSIARPDFSTVYTYDTCGRMVSAVSTSGTLERYTYDAYDRVVTARDSVPDGKWLQKAYTYNADGQVASISYTSQGGYITTEAYVYDNGYNTSITLPDNTVVFSLTSENDLGQPTAATTASVSRTYGYTDYGLPTFRKLDNGALQQFTYNFDAATGNLSSRSRTAGGNTTSESFTYDNLGRLTGAGGNAVTYDNRNNITSMGGVGTMSYAANTRPFNITSLETSSSATIGTANQGIFYTAYDRPYMMMQGLAEAYFTYDAKLNRVKMLYYDTSGDEGANYYVGDRYEIRRAAGTTTDTQLLYLGGDAYSAPMVLRKQGGGSWTPYVIGRDYLGSITHIATTGGTLVEERSYDAWGRLRDPATNAAYDAASQPSLFLGRGWCGHEYLAGFGLYNLNARIYDPVLGRFLSPDPYVQAPDNPANFNRYAYGLNNPLKYTDESGEVIVSALLISIGIGAIVNVAFNMNSIDNFWEGFAVAAVGGVSGALAVLSGGSSLWLQVGAGIGAGAANSVIINGVQQLGASGNGSNALSSLDWKQIGRAAISGAISGATTAGVNASINGNRIATLLDKVGIEKSSARNIIGNTIEGATTGLVAGGTNGLGTQFIEKGFNLKWDWGLIGKSALMGVSLGGTMGSFSGIIQEHNYQQQLKKGYSPWRSSDIADATGEFAGSTTSHLEATNSQGWPFGHNYAHEYIDLPGIIFIAPKTNTCTINIDPYAPMVPTQPSYNYPKP